ncbi:hypothetical protein CNR22_06085 [Sphingobacteriaceae bacterium]|nr:hypothetical protein CNR22_06085 [Sphingobacteriaceae bacterium]
MKKNSAFILIFFLSLCNTIYSQQEMETGGKEMPDEWIDKDTKHKVVCISRREGINLSFYFHNNPFVGNKMVFYGSNERQKENYPGELKNKSQEIYNLNVKNKQLYLLDLATLKIEQLTHNGSAMAGEILSASTHEIFYQINDSVFATDVNTKKERLLYVFPNDFKGNITSVNSDGTLLGGAWGTDKEKELFKKYPEKHDFFNIVFEAHLPRTLFTLNTKTAQLNKIWTDSAWLNHVQFSTTNPNLLMFCHEGPWHKVDRIWTIDVVSKEVTKVHTRTMENEIAGHEWFSADGKTIWFDLQMPKGETFFVAGRDVASGREKKFALKRDEWSIHFNSSKDNLTFCGDGGDPGQVAKAKDGQWIYLFIPEGDHFTSEKLVNMKNHNYKLEPNVHFSPDEKWIIFRANFEGKEEIYAVKIEKEK